MSNQSLGFGLWRFGLACLHRWRRLTGSVARWAWAIAVGLSPIAALSQQLEGDPWGTDLTPPDVIAPGAWEGVSEAIRERLAGTDTAPEGQVVLLVSAEAQHLLKSAADAVQRGDWKVAIDAFQRIGEQYGGELLSAEGDLYESGRRCVRRLLAELPPEGLATFRLLNDAEASALYARARRDHNLDALRSVVDRYFLTTIGDDAADLLAAWLIDVGQPAEALALLDDLERFYRDRDVPAGMVAARRAIALAMLGDLSAAEELEQQADGSLQPSIVPGDWHQGVGELAHAVWGFEAAARASATGGWPALLGGGRCLGRMPAIEPRLMDISEWRVWIDSEEPAEDAFGIPLSYPIVGGGRLIVKTGTQLLGFDPETMQRVWQTAPSAASFDPVASMWGRQPLIIPTPDGGYRLQGVVRSDDVSWVASVVGDVVCYIDLWGRSVVTEADPVAADTPQGAAAATGVSLARANRLVACDAASGAVRWSRGRSSRPDDPLAQVTFRSLPVPAGDDIVALYERGAELLLGRLDRATGALLAERPLCGVPGLAWGPGDCLMISAADGLILVPTDRGCLLAVNAHDLSLRWVLRYAGKRGRSGPDWWETDGSRAQRGWALSPPIIAGATVLLAAADTDELIAVDRRSGRLQWRLSRQDFRYVAAADRLSCWLVGRRAAAVDLATGQLRWSLPVGSVTGRAALSGDRLYLPTSRAVLVLSAQTGELLETLPLPAHQSPLGNLLCYGGALFSVDGLQVRKYPDLDAAYTKTRTSFAAAGASDSLAIRLAWLEVLRGDPEAALTVLEAVPASETADIRRRMHLDQLRVRCLLELADAAGDDLERSETYLRRAAELAVSPTERTRTCLALARLAARQGNAVDAFMKYLIVSEAAADGHGDDDRDTAALVPVPGGGQRHVCDIVRQEMIALQPRLTDQERASLRSSLTARVQAATDRRDYATMALYAELELPFGLGREAGIRLGRWEVEEERYEVAAGWFVNAIDGDGGSPQAPQAVSELAELYLRPEVHSPASAAELAERLVAAHSAQAMRAGWLASLSPQEVQQRRKARERARFQVPNERVRSVAHVSPRLVSLAGSAPEIMEDRLLLATAEDRLICEAMVDGEPLWEANLRLDRGSGWPDGWDTVVEFDSRGVPIPPALPPIPAVCDGLVLIVRGPDGLHGIGAGTGRAIWFRSMRGGPPAGTGLEDQRLAYEHGLLAFRPTAGVLEVIRAGTGRTVWRREIRPSDAGSLLMVDGRLLALSEDRSRVQVFDAADGTRRPELSFAQPPEPLDVVVFGGVVCGPDDDAVVGYDLETNDRLWRHRPGRAAIRLFDASADVLGVGARKGQVEFLDARSGRVLLRVPPESAVQEFHDAAISGDVVCIAGESDRGDLMLAGIDLRTGQHLWGPKVIAGAVELFPGWLRGSATLIAVLSDGKRDLRLEMLDKRTGDRVGEDWRFPAAGRRGAGPSLQWFPGYLVVGNGQRWWVFSAAPPRGGDEHL